MTKEGQNVSIKYYTKNKQLSDTNPTNIRGELMAS